MLAAVLVPVARRVAVRLRLTVPTARGSWHRAPTPYLGGLALAAAVVVAAAGARGWERDAAVLMVAALAVCLVGLVDDCSTASLRLRLGVEVAAAVAAFAGGSRLGIGPGPVALVVTAAWVVVVTNGCNLLDNVDGALGSIGAVIAAAVGVAALLGHQFLVAGLAFAVAGACLGFLVHNWPPATIFMGDAGSLFLGFLLATLALRLDTPAAPFASAVAAALLVAPALLDTSLVVVSRRRAGRSILVGGTDHTAHRLRRAGLGPRAAVGVLVAATAVWCACGVAVARGTIPALAGLALLALPAAPIFALLATRPAPTLAADVPDAGGLRRGHA